MRRISRFKAFKKTKSFLLDCPNKILKFKKSNWLPYKNIITNKEKLRSFFVNYSMVNCKKTGGFQKKASFSTNLKLRRLISQHFDNAIKWKTFQQILSKRFKKIQKSNVNVAKEVFMHFEYRLDILLYRLGFFSSAHHAKQSIQHGHVLVNTKPLLTSNYFVQKGDIISILPLLGNLIEKSMLKKLRTPYLQSFLEVDYYTQTAVVVKTVDELSVYDLALMSNLQVRSSRLYQAFKFE